MPGEAGEGIFVAAAAGRAVIVALSLEKRLAAAARRNPLLPWRPVRIRLLSAPAEPRANLEATRYLPQLRVPGVAPEWMT